MTTEHGPMTLTPSEGGSAAWASLTAGIYPAVLTEITDEGVSTAYPEAGPRYKLTFTLSEISDDEGNPIALYRWVSQKLTLGAKPSKLTEFATALGLPPVVGQPYAVDRLIGRHCQLFVNLKETPNGTRPFIADVLPRVVKPSPIPRSLPAQVNFGPTPGLARASADATPPWLAGVSAVTTAPSPPVGRADTEDVLADDGPGPELGPCFICDGPAVAYDGRGREVCELHRTV